MYICVYIILFTRYLHDCILLPQFLSEVFQPRTRDTHANQCASLHGSLHGHFATTFGLHRDSILNTSRYFHVTEGLVPDIMHDILEGCLAYEVKELLKYLIQNRTITLTEFSGIVKSFPYIGSDSRNKPTEIAASTLSSSDHSLKQTGMLHVHVFLDYSCCVPCPIILFSNTDVVFRKTSSIDDRRKNLPR